MEKWAKLFLSLLPQKALSKFVGSLSRSKLSRFLIPLFIKKYHINSEEAEKPIDAYVSINDFFTRKLKPGARRSQHEPSSIISPVDGVVSQVGEIHNGTLIQAKGIHYTVEQLLGNSHKDTFENGSYMVVYLSPKDYHRIHSPLSGTITGSQYTPGRLYPVNSIGVNHVQGLFTKNERVTTFLSQGNKQAALVKVGAFIVGSVQTTYTSNIISHGDEIGYFQFGSTIILILDKNMGTLDKILEGTVLQLGDRIGNLSSSSL